MDNFDLKKYLVETKMTRNSRLVESVEVNGKMYSDTEEYYDGTSDLPVGTVLKGRGHYIVVLGHDGDHYETEIVGGEGYGGKSKTHRDSLKHFPMMQLDESAADEDEVHEATY